jgi:hypothetical protein
VTADQIQFWLRNEKPHERSWDEWIAKWWQWLVSAPLEESPVNDHSGEFCARDQKQPVWNLAGPITGALADRGYRLGEHKVTRSCNIPEGWSILAPLAVGEVTRLEYPSHDPNELLTRFVQEHFVSHLMVKINEESYPQKYFDENKLDIVTANFELKYGDDNIFGVEGGQAAEAASRGYWLFIKKTPAEFTLEVQQTTEAHPLIESEKFSYDIIYNIKRT